MVLLRAGQLLILSRLVNVVARSRGPSVLTREPFLTDLWQGTQGRLGALRTEREGLGQIAALHQLSWLNSTMSSTLLRASKTLAFVTVLMLLGGGIPYTGWPEVEASSRWTSSFHPLTHGDTPASQPTFRYGGQISLGPPGSPSGVAFDNRTDELYLAEAPRYVSVFAVSPITFVQSILLPQNSEPIAMTYDSANDTVFVGTNFDSVIVISGETHQIAANVSIRTIAVDMTYDARTGTVYAAGGFANGLNYNITAINGSTYAVHNLNLLTVAPMLSFSLTVDPTTGYLIAVGYVGFSGWDGVGAFDPVTGSLIWYDQGYTLTNYQSVAVDGAIGEVLLPSAVNSSVVILAEASGIYLGDIPFVSGSGIPTSASAFNSRSGRLLVGLDNNRVEVVDIANATALADLPVHGTPWAVSVDLESSTAFVTSPDTASLTVIASNESSVTSTTNVGGTPNAVAFDNRTGNVYVASSDNLTVINGSSRLVVATVGVGSDPQGLLYDPTSDELFVANTGSNTISVVSPTSNKVIATISVDPDPWGLAWDSRTNAIYVSCMNFTGQGVVDVFSATTLRLIASIPLGGESPQGLAYVPSLDEVFVTGVTLYPPMPLTIISAVSNAVVGSVGLPNASAPGEVVPNSVSSNLYIAGSGFWINGDFRQDIVVDPTNRTVIGTIPVGVGPYGVLVVDGTLFATAWASDTVTVFNTSSQQVLEVITLPRDSSPEGLAYDPFSGTAFVADRGNDSVTVLSKPSPNELGVNFTESGLPRGDYWSVGLRGGVAAESNSSEITFTEPNGTYAFQVQVPLGHTATPAAGLVNVTGSAVNVAIRISALQGASTHIDWLWWLVGGGTASGLVALAAWVRKRRASMTPTEGRK